MLLSVVICTWQRSALLRATLEHIAVHLQVPEDLTWELIVVDNGSTDETAAVVGAFSGRLPIEYVVEPRLGHSHARNRGASVARGEYVLWTDDDVLVDERWLVEYRDAFARHPEAAVFGGPVEPWFPNEPPTWLVQSLPLLQVPYALRDFGTRVAPLEADRLPFGANFAVRASELRAHPFDTRLGNRGLERVAGEETKVMRAILEAGGGGWWVPSARVRHYLPVERQSVEYLREYYHARGRRLRLEEGPGNGGARWRWVPRAVLGELAYRATAWFAPPTVWVRALRLSAIARGYLSG
jgi:glucosyl-dolichyl phosphate glucuronosyltransferase